MAMIREAPAHSRQQSDPVVGLPQQQRSTLGAQLPLVKAGAHLPRKMWCKGELSLVTLCHRKGRLSWDINYDFDNAVMPENAAFFYCQFFRCYSFRLVCMRN